MIRLMPDRPDYAALGGEGHVGAIDLGGTKIFGAVFAPDGRIVGRATVLVGRDRTPSAVVDRLAEAIDAAAADARLARRELRAVATGAPSPVELATGVVVHAPNLGWHQPVPLRDQLGRRLGMPVAVENDVRAAVLGENAAGAGRGVRNWVGVWPGTGIGGGVVIDGELFRGASNSAGEFGHMTVKAGGVPCGCGGLGHLESYASRTGIVNAIAEAVRGGERTVLSEWVGGDLTLASGADLGRAWRAGDAIVGRVVEEAATYLAVGIASIANCINPELVVFGGGVVEGLGDRFLALVAERLRGQEMVAATDPLRLVRCQLGDDAGLCGAALAARRVALAPSSPGGGSG
jgi:glucokinase